MSQESSGYLNLANLKVIETLYERWRVDQNSVDLSWQNFFEGMQFAAHLPQAFPQRVESRDLRVYYLINAYRTYGHLMAESNVIATEKPQLPDELKLEHFGLSEKDLQTDFPTAGFLDKETAPLKEIIEALQSTYCGATAFEYMDLGSVEIEKWIQKEIEPGFPTNLSNEERIEILKELNKAEGFETFIHTKYVGQKRFSLEGAETLIPMMNALLETGADAGVSDVLIGMAHRGRLNVLANIMGKSYEYIFEEFEDHYTPDLSESTGDVKYHMGFGGTYTSKNGKKIQVILSANPSHLESVDPVLEGGARAIQELKKPRENEKEVVPVLIHGDASVAGQGVVYETMTFSNLKGYKTNGTVHIVVNNQIGYTTLPKDSRSTRYCTDIAKAFGAPVFHVSAEDPEECVAATRLAVRLRQQFGCDVFIDLMGYRKYGHNESDEPAFTQPLEYQIIRAKKTIREIYRNKLIQTGVLSLENAENFEKEFKESLNQVLQTVKSKVDTKALELREPSRHLAELLSPFDTKVPKERLLELGSKITSAPTGFNVHPKVLKLLENRQKMFSEDPQSPVFDWGMAELLAYGSLCEEGTHVRLSGQDCRRGTFAHRHAILVDQVDDSHYFPLSHLSETQAPCDVFNSPLSEFATLGFEFGYSLMYPNSLVLWEAQYGDFFNGAQITVDQYISTSEMKWGHVCNLTLLLPHGYEGGGPEHSSARIERFLQLAADENMIIANCTTPSQFFHLLRRQALRPLKKPLIVFTPKVLLRHPQCRSSLNDLSEGNFEEIMDDPNPPENPKRVVLCSGKIFYELLKERAERGGDFAILRIEQLYPLHIEKLENLIKKYSAEKYIWFQEEHENMGAWSYLQPILLEKGISLHYVGRERNASPAAGSHALHELQHKKIMQELFI